MLLHISFLFIGGGVGARGQCMLGLSLRSKSIESNAPIHPWVVLCFKLWSSRFFNTHAHTEPSGSWLEIEGLRAFEPNQRHCIGSLSKILILALSLVQEDPSRHISKGVESDVKCKIKLRETLLRACCCYIYHMAVVSTCILSRNKLVFTQRQLVLN